jgi:hypothetical protein
MILYILIAASNVAAFYLGHLWTIRKLNKAMEHIDKEVEEMMRAMLKRANKIKDEIK